MSEARPPYTIIRQFRGSWPNWCADLDDGRVVFVYVRYGEARVGIGADEYEASEDAERVDVGDRYAGVTDALTALEVLARAGYHYVCPADRGLTR